MSKMSELDIVLQEFHAAAKALISAADSLRDLYSKPAEPNPPDALQKEKPKPPKPPTITLEQVRGVLAEKSRNGLTAEVRELLKEFGADKLSGVDPECYEALLRKAEVLGNG